jgi:hyperosmotically inducible protein
MKSINPRVLNVAIASMLGAFTVASFAATPAMPAFKAADSNGDGMVSMVEFSAQGGSEEAFREGDANNDSRLTSDEYTAAVAKHDSTSGKFMDDAWITAKVKASLLKDEGLKGLSVKVETEKGIVRLAGSVSSQEQIIRAEKIAQGVEGVKAVRNDLLVKN